MVDFLRFEVGIFAAYIEVLLFITGEDKEMVLHSCGFVPRPSSKKMGTEHKGNSYPKFPQQRMVVLDMKRWMKTKSFLRKTKYRPILRHKLVTRKNAPDVDDLAQSLLRIVCPPNLPTASLVCCCAWGAPDLFCGL